MDGLWAGMCMYVCVYIYTHTHMLEDFLKDLVEILNYVIQSGSVEPLCKFCLCA